MMTGLSTEAREKVEALGEKDREELRRAMEGGNAVVGADGQGEARGRVRRRERVRGVGGRDGGRGGPFLGAWGRGARG